MKEPLLSEERYRLKRGRTTNLRDGVLDIVGAGMAPPGSTAASLRRHQNVATYSTWE